MLSIAQLIAGAAPALGDLRLSLLGARAMLEQGKAAAPDLAPLFDEKIADLDAKIAALDQATSVEGLARLGVAVAQELAGLPHTGIVSAFHPGDVTGG